jgi:hypothetical protein
MSSQIPVDYGMQLCQCTMSDQKSWHANVSIMSMHYVRPEVMACKCQCTMSDQKSCHANVSIMSMHCQTRSHGMQMSQRNQLEFVKVIFLCFISGKFEYLTILTIMSGYARF